MAIGGKGERTLFWLGISQKHTFGRGKGKPRPVAKDCSEIQLVIASEISRHGSVIISHGSFGVRQGLIFEIIIDKGCNSLIFFAGYSAAFGLVKNCFHLAA